MKKISSLVSDRTIDTSIYLKNLYPELYAHHALPKTLRELTQAIHDKFTEFPIFQHTIPYEKDENIARESAHQLEMIKENHTRFYTLPNKLLNRQICLSILKNTPHLHPMIPRHFMDKELWLLTLQENGTELRDAPPEIKKDKACCLASVTNSGIMLEYVPNDSQDFEMCLNAVTENPNAICYVNDENQIHEIHQCVIEQNPQLINKIPKWARSREICLLAIEKDIKLIKYIPENLLDERMCLDILRICHKERKKAESLLKIRGLYIKRHNRSESTKEDTLEITKPFKNEEAYIQSLRNLYISFCSIADENITFNMCLEALRIHKDHHIFIPKRHQTPELYTQLFKERLIIWKNIPDHIRMEIAEKTRAIPLTTLHDSPMDFTTYHYQEVLMNELSERALQIPENIYNQFFEICHPKTEITQAEQLVSPTMNEDEEKHLEDSAIFGGRTLKKEGHFFKFWREGEPLSVFLREYNTTQLLNQVPIGLKSEIPRPISITRLRKTIKTTLFVSQFTDKPEITTDKKTGEKYYLVYHYQASENYGIYAYQKNLNTKTPFKEAENGLLKGIHDIGRLARNGILYTNVLPTFHKKNDKNISWMVLTKIFMNDKANYPGSMIAWSTKATEYPDYGYSGLRDFGDFSLLGTTLDYMQRGAMQTRKPTTWKQSQKASLYNAINENIFATLLLYARLHQKEDYFHYMNTETIQKTHLFIHKILTNFLKGYLGDTCPSVHKFMKLTENDYNLWLENTSRKLIYWTAPQDPEKECYVKHILKDYHLPFELYRNQRFLRAYSQNIHPYMGYVDRDQEPSLGPPHTHSILMNFFEGLALLNTELEKYTMPPLKKMSLYFPPLS